MPILACQEKCIWRLYKSLLFFLSFSNCLQWRQQSICLHFPLLAPLSCPFSKDVAISNLKVATQYRVSVGAYGWAGEGRPSMPRDVSTASHGGQKCSLPFSKIMGIEMLALNRTKVLKCYCFLGSFLFSSVFQ